MTNKLPYAIAVVAALGIAVVVMNVGNDAADNVASPSVTQVSQTPGEVTLAVPQMHCQYSCFPRVKEALEASPAVESVELAPQKDPTVLDNHAVVVQYAAGFDPAGAVAALEKEGFSDSSVVQ